MKTDYLFDHFKYLEYDDDPEKQEELIKKHKNSGVLELINELDNARANPIEDEETQRAIVTVLKRLIAKKLDFYDNDHAGFLIDHLPGLVEELERDLKKLENIFKSHRHNTDRHYSEKPSW